MTEIVVPKEILECPVCLEQLDETSKMLPCQHTYCKNCLKRVFQEENLLRCPQCRREVSDVLYKSHIDFLPTNLCLLSVIELVNKTPPRRPPRHRDENQEIKFALISSLQDDNEQLRLQLAMESSKRDDLLKKISEMSDQLNWFYESQKTMENVRRHNEDLLREKRKLELEVAYLKTAQEARKIVTSNHFDISKKTSESLCETHLDDLKEDTHNIICPDHSIQKTMKPDEFSINEVSEKIEKLNLKNSKEQTNNAGNIPFDSLPGRDTPVVDEIMKKLDEVKTLLNENQTEKAPLRIKTNDTYQTCNKLPFSKLRPGFIVGYHRTSSPDLPEQSLNQELANYPDYYPVNATSATTPTSGDPNFRFYDDSEIPSSTSFTFHRRVNASRGRSKLPHSKPTGCFRNDGKGKQFSSEVEEMQPLAGPSKYQENSNRRRGRRTRSPSDYRLSRRNENRETFFDESTKTVQTGLSDLEKENPNRRRSFNRNCSPTDHSFSNDEFSRCKKSSRSSFDEGSVTAQASSSNFKNGQAFRGRKRSRRRKSKSSVRTDCRESNSGINTSFCTNDSGESNDIRQSFGRTRDSRTHNFRGVSRGWNPQFVDPSDHNMFTRGATKRN